MRSSSRVSAIVVLVLASLPFTARAQVSVRVAQDLYMAADYEGALDTLARLEQAGVSPEATEVARYRLLCLLALGRVDQARESAQTLVELAPFTHLSEDDASPTVRARFAEWRLERLPELARAGYARAKESYARKQYATAATQFGDVLRLLAELDENSKAAAAALADMRVLAADFHQLSVLAAQPKPVPTAQPVAAAPTPAPVGTAVPTSVVAGAGPPPPNVPTSIAATAPMPASTPASEAPATRAAASAASTSPSAPPESGITLAGLSVTPPSASASRTSTPPASSPATAPPAARVYTASDTTVAPPRALRQNLPPWPPQLPKSLPGGDRAILDLVIGADGLVETAQVRKGLHPLYDTILLQSARNWRYDPAKLNGQAVRYARALELRVQLQ